MKKKKTLALVLALLMLAPAVVSCSNNSASGDENETTAPTSAEPQTEAAADETEAPDPFAGITFDGRDFRVSTSTNQAEITFSTSNNYIEGPEELTGDAAIDAAFERNVYVEDLLDVNMVYTQETVGYDGVANLVRGYVQAAEDSFDLIINDIYGTAPLSVEGAFHNTLNLANFDFSKPYWYSDFMRDITMNYNYQYMLAGDYFIDVLRSSHGMIFNKSLYADMFGDGEALYETVLNGQWTYDVLLDIMSSSYVDTNGNGQKDKNDLYGYVAQQFWGPMIPFLISANPGFVERDENGYPTITVYNERSLTLCDYLEKFFDNQGVGAYLVFNDKAEDVIANFTSGLSIFIGQQRLGSLEYSVFRSMEQEIGIIPYPKLTEADEYITSAHDTSEVGLIPITAPEKNLDYISTVIEVLNRETNKSVLPVYYENALKVKYTRDNASAQMIDIIHDNLGDSFALAWSNELDQILMQNTFFQVINSGGEFASYYNSRIKAAEKKLENIIDAFETRD